MAVVRVGRRVGEGEGGGVGLDEHIDQVQRDGVVVRGGQAPGAGQVRVDLDDEQPVGVPPGAEQLVPGAAHVQGEVDGPGSSGGAAWATMTRGANRAMIGPICRKPPGTSSTWWPRECWTRSAGPKKPQR